MSLVSESSSGGVVSFARNLVQFYRDRDVPLLAGSVAYSAFLSLVPLVLCWWFSRRSSAGRRSDRPCCRWRGST